MSAAATTFLPLRRPVSWYVSELLARKSLCLVNDKAVTTAPSFVYNYTTVTTFYIYTEGIIKPDRLI